MTNKLQYYQSGDVFLSIGAGLGFVITAYKTNNKLLYLNCRNKIVLDCPCYVDNEDECESLICTAQN